MRSSIKLTDRIGTRESDVLETLRASIDVSDLFTDAQTEVVRHIVDHPDRHRRDINAIASEGFTFADLASSLQRTDPTTWGYPAKSWETVQRVYDLRTNTVLTAELAVVEALDEQDYPREEIAELLGVSPATVDDRQHRVARQIDLAKNTVDRLDA